MVKTIYTPKLRWYDGRPNLTQPLGLLLKFPPTFLTILADGLNLLAEQQYQAHIILKTLKNLGKDKVLALYQSKQKRRAVDQDPLTHNIYNYLYVLPEADQNRYAKQMMELFQLVLEYLRAVRSAGAMAQPESIAMITNVFVAKGAAETQYFLDNLVIEMRQLVPIGEPRVYTLGDAAESVVDRDSGMRIRGEN